MLSGLNEEYRNAEALLEQMKQKLDDAQAELDKQAAEGQAQLDAAKAQIDSGKAQLSAASAELESQRVSGLAKLQNARYSLQLAKTEYANGVSESSVRRSGMYLTVTITPDIQHSRRTPTGSTRSRLYFRCSSCWSRFSSA